MIERENFITIQGFMVTDLQLSGNDLLVYATIYGFSQGQQGKYTGSLSYLAEWCRCTKQGVQKNLKKLQERGLIKKESYMRNGQKFCDYSVTELHTMQQSCMGGIQHSCIPMQHSCTHNIEHNIDNNNISKKKTLSTNVDNAKEKEFSFDKHSNKENLIYLLDNNPDYENLKGEFRQAMIDWMEYKDERRPKKNNHYVESGMKRWITLTINNAKEYGAKNVIKQIDKAIASQWAGTNYDMLERVGNGK